MNTTVVEHDFCDNSDKGSNNLSPLSLDENIVSITIFSPQYQA